jgi:very-short-patch-repair endonuclease
LLDLGYSSKAIDHRIARGRLHPIWRGVYAVGRPDVTPRGRWMAAVLSCGRDAVLSHTSAAALWGIGSERRGKVEVSVPARVARSRPRILVHRRANLTSGDVTRYDGIPVTSPVPTLVDFATCVSRDRLEAAVSEADRLDLTDPDALRSALADLPRRPGAAVLRRVLDRRTFALTSSQLERWFLPIARRAGLPKPKTRQRVNGFEVDFHWSEIGLVVETDGLRYHRTPRQQAKDRVRDQAHAAAGLTPLRFTHDQVRFQPRHVEATLRAVAGRLAGQVARPG